MSEIVGQIHFDINYLEQYGFKVEKILITQEIFDNETTWLPKTFNKNAIETFFGYPLEISNNVEHYSIMTKRHGI